MAASDKSAIRAAAIAALQASPHFSGFRQISGWVQSVDATSLPAIAVATPEERRGGAGDTSDSQRREVTLVVIAKRIGSALIEDDLDADADAAEAALLPVLRTVHQACEFSRAVVRLDGSGAQMVGTLEIGFAVTYWADDPA